MLYRKAFASAAVAALVGMIAVQEARAQVVISQAYGGFSAPGADFVELFNRGTTPVDLTGWSVQVSYNASTEAWHKIDLTSLVLQPGQYYLVAVSTDVGTLPTPDAVGTETDSTLIFSNQGGVALVDIAVALPTGCPVGNPNLKDLLVFGGTVPCYEGTGQGPVTSSSQSVLRLNHGCTDTNDNATDFAVGTPNPRNSTYQFPFEAITSFGNIAATAGATITITARGRSNACSATGNVDLTGVTVDLTQVGGSGSLPMVDDGSGGDAVANDDIWTVRYTIPIATPTGSYPVTFNYSSGLGSATRTASLVVPILGDTCAASKLIPSLPFTETPVTTNFTDDDLIIPCRSVTTVTVSRFGQWYEITPTSDFVMKVSKNSTLFNLSLFTGPCDSPTIVDCDDSNIAANFRLRAGITYHIFAFYDNSNTPGTNATYTFDAITPPGNDLCSGAIDLNAQTLPFTDTNNAGFFDATADADNPCDGIPLVTRRGVWYSYLPAVDSIIKTAETGSGIIVSSSVWTGSCPSGLTLYGCSTTENFSSYFLPAGQRYYILIGSNSTAQPGTSTTGYNNTFSVAPAPANDVCATATNVGSLATPFSSSVVLSTASADTTTCGSATFGVWYTFVAPSKGALRLTEASSVDVSWAVVSACSGGNSLLCTTTDTDQYVDTEAGQQVYILLYTTSTSATAATPSLSFIPQLPNDICSGAVDLTGQAFPFSTQADARGSTVHDMDIGTCTTQSSSSFAIWYRFTPATSGLFTIADSSSDNVDIGIWQATNAADPCNSLGTQIGCIANSNDAGVFPVTAGTTYVVLLGSQPGTSGPVRPAGAYNLTFNLVEPLANDACAGAQDLSGQIPTGLTPLALPDIGSFIAQDEPDTSCNPATATVLRNGVWFAYLPATNQTITMWDANQRSMNFTLYASCGGSELACATNSSTFTLTAGVRYYILAGLNLIDPSAANGVYALRFLQTQSLANDPCDGAYSMSSFPYQVVIDASFASADPPSMVQSGCNSPAAATDVEHAVWYKIQTLTAGTLSGGIEPDGDGSGGAIAAVYQSFDGTCAGINPSSIWCGSDPSTPILTPITVNVALAANTTYYLQIGIAGTNPSTSSFDDVFFIDLSFDGQVAGGICCRGATCTTSISSQAACSGSLTPGALAGASFVSTSPTCNAPGNTVTPCCYADYNKAGGIAVQDIFDFLNDWFAGRLYAKVGGDGTSGTLAVQDIFDFLNAWFAGC